MSLRLRDKNVIVTVDVEGTTLHLRNLNQGDVEEFLFNIQQGKNLSNLRQHLTEIVTKIEGVEGLNGQPTDVGAILRELDDVSFGKCLNAVLDHISLSYEQQKNWRRSSDTSARPAGLALSVDAPVNPATENAGAIKSE